MSVYSELFDVQRLELCGSSARGRLWMSRLLVLHYLLLLGYNVMLLDSDAVVIRNPQSVFHALAESHDVVLGKGKFPYSLNSKWGFTGCFGTSFFKSSAGTSNSSMYTYSPCSVL